MEQDALRESIQIHFGTAYMSRQGLRIRTNHDPIEAGYVVNAAGLYTDKIAMGCGFSKHYRVLPFKGLYLYSNESPDSIRCNIYPVPDLRNPFLGVHFTITAEDKTKIGQRRSLPHAGLPRHHSVPPPERLAPPARAGIQMGIGVIDYSVIVLTVFLQRYSASTAQSWVKIAHPNYRQVSSRSEASPQFLPLPLLPRVTQTLTPYVRGGSIPFAGIAQPMTHASNTLLSVLGLNAQL
jgi:FAD dependent oxidoreductase